MEAPRTAGAKCCWRCPGEWSEWSAWLAAGIHVRNRWRLPMLLAGKLFAHGSGTASTWLRAASISDDFDACYCFLAAVGRMNESVATRLAALVLRTMPLPEQLLAVIDDSPIKRYGPQVKGADIHRSPTPGPANQKCFFGHIWVTLSQAVRHPLWGAMALPLRGMLYVRQRRLAVNREDWITIVTAADNGQGTPPEILNAICELFVPESNSLSRTEGRMGKRMGTR